MHKWVKYKWRTILCQNSSRVTGPLETYTQIRQERQWSMWILWNESHPGTYDLGIWQMGGEKTRDGYGGIMWNKKLEMYQRGYKESYKNYNKLINGANKSRRYMASFTNNHFWSFVPRFKTVSRNIWKFLNIYAFFSFGWQGTESRHMEMKIKRCFFLK